MNNLSGRRNLLKLAAGLSVASAGGQVNAVITKNSGKNPGATALLTVDVVVIGAGFAGLVAAHELVSTGKTVHLLEARDRIGGRTESIKIAGQTLDIGGMWAGEQQHRLLKLARKYNIQTYPTYLKGKNFIEYSGGSGQSEGEDLVAVMSISQKLDYMQVEQKISKLVSQISIDKPWNHPEAEKLDGMTFQSWLENSTYTEGVKSIFNSICASVLCCTPSQISPLFFGWYLASSGGLSVLISTKGGAQELLFKGSVNQIAKIMAEELRGAITTDSPVSRITQTTNNIVVESLKVNVQARRVIVAIPPPLHNSIDFRPGLPASKIALSQRSPMGSVIKILIAYATPFWRNAGFNGFTSKESAFLNPTFDVSPPGQPFGVLVGFVDADRAISAGKLTAEARKQKILTDLVSIFGVLAFTPLDFIERNWNEEKWSHGCYGAYMTPGTLMRYGSERFKPVGKIHWAGTETAMQWSGYIEGAIESGYRCAKEVNTSLSSEKTTRIANEVTR